MIKVLTHQKILSHLKKIYFVIRSYQIRHWKIIKYKTNNNKIVNRNHKILILLFKVIKDVTTEIKLNEISD